MRAEAESESSSSISGAESVSSTSDTTSSAFSGLRLIKVPDGIETASIAFARGNQRGREAGRRGLTVAAMRRRRLLRRLFGKHDDRMVQFDLFDAQPFRPEGGHSNGSGDLYELGRNAFRLRRECHIFRYDREVRKDGELHGAVERNRTAGRRRQLPAELGTHPVAGNQARQNNNCCDRERVSTQKTKNKAPHRILLGVKGVDSLSISRKRDFAIVF